MLKRVSRTEALPNCPNVVLPLVSTRKAREEWKIWESIVDDLGPQDADLILASNIRDALSAYLEPDVSYEDVTDLSAVHAMARFLRFSPILENEAHRADEIAGTYAGNHVAFMFDEHETQTGTGGALGLIVTRETFFGDFGAERENSGIDPSSAWYRAEESGLYVHASDPARLSPELTDEIGRFDDIPDSPSTVELLQNAVRLQPYLSRTFLLT